MSRIKDIQDNLEEKHFCPNPYCEKLDEDMHWLIARVRNLESAIVKFKSRMMEDLEDNHDLWDAFPVLDDALEDS